MDNIIGYDTLYDALQEIVNRIELCGASPNLTNAVSLASDLKQSIDVNNVNREYALQRVKHALQSAKALNNNLFGLFQSPQYIIKILFNIAYLISLLKVVYTL